MRSSGSQASFELARIDEEANYFELVNPKTKIAVSIHKNYCSDAFKAIFLP
jgi:hypothetical protein